MKHEKETTAVAVLDTPQTDMVVAGSALDLLMQSEGLGREHLNANDVATPFYTILQKASPQVDEASTGKFIEGSKVGMILNTATKELIDGKTGFEAVLCASDKRWVQWRDNRGGYVGSHLYKGPQPPFPCKRDAKKKFRIIGTGVEGEEDLLTETQYYFLLRVCNGVGSPAIVGCTYSQMKPARVFNTNWSEHTLTIGGKTFKAPIFSQLFRFTTVAEVKDNFTFYNWVITPMRNLGESDKPLLLDAMKANKDYEAGLVTIGAPPEDTGDGNKSDADEQVPY